MKASCASIIRDNSERRINFEQIKRDVREIFRLFIQIALKLHQRFLLQITSYLIELEVEIFREVEIKQSFEVR